MTTTQVPMIKLNDSRQIPQIGLGLWKVKDEAEFAAVFTASLAAGYRHFDSAQAYGNEQYLGTAWKQSDFQRDELWLTTKIAVEHFGYNHAQKAFAESIEKLQTDYVDLVLLHFPVTLLRKKSWTALEEIKAAGGAKSIGVSNYTIKHLQDMEKYAQEMPAVNQVELHVFLQQQELIEYCRQRGIAIEAYSPLAHAKAGADDEVLQALASKYNKTYAQIMLRWCVDRGLVVLPKSVTPERIKENIAIFDFELSPEDMDQLRSLDRNLRTCWDPTLIP